RQSCLFVVIPGMMCRKPIQSGTHFRICVQLREARSAVGREGNDWANRHGQQNTRKHQAFQAPIANEFQCRVTPAESASSSSSVSTRADLLPASSRLATTAASA